MANACIPGPIGVYGNWLDPRDGTNSLSQSPLPGPLLYCTLDQRKRIPDAVSHYDVEPGDTIASVCLHKLQDPFLCHDFARLNGLSSLDRLHPGQRLIVPDFQRSDLTADYMVSQMRDNAVSEETRAIAAAIVRSRQADRDADAALRDMRKARWYEVFRMYGDQQLLEAAVQRSGVRMAEAFARWFLLVRQDGPWDHKPILAKKYADMPSPPRPFGDLGRAFHFPIRGDALHEYYYDVWSNIHYGFVGACCGFDEETLQQGAASGFPGAGANDEGDVISVRIGIELWQGKGLSIRAGDLCAAIVARAGDYLAARQRDIGAGKTPEKAINVVISGNDYK